MARGLSEPSGERSRSAVRAGRLQLAREIIDRELHKSELSPADMAARLGVSVRHLLLLFEPTGTSYARYVLGRRLERARLLLVQSPDAAVADIAHACGFQSLATFYRVLRAAFGLSPGECREIAAKSAND
jgi:transcriptional regulator GlxA family with amidase domain